MNIEQCLAASDPQT